VAPNLLCAAQWRQTENLLRVVRKTPTTTADDLLTVAKQYLRGRR